MHVNNANQTRRVRRRGKLERTNSNPGIAPIESHPHGKTYSDWAAAWWKWVLQIPASDNPLLNNGACNVGQVGRVWFLSGSFVPLTEPRTCTVPTGTSLFFPVINLGGFAFLNDPPEKRTEKFLRSEATCDVTQLDVEIDGVPVNQPAQYFEQSPLFDVQLPADNVYGLTENDAPQLLLSPSVDAGYYLFLHPLPPGQHTIQWSAQCHAPVGDFDLQQNVTYEITVLPNKKCR